MLAERKTLLGLFERHDPATSPRTGHPQLRDGVLLHASPTSSTRLPSIVKKPVTVEAAAIGVAGPVVDDVATLTNVGGMQSRLTRSALGLAHAARACSTISKPWRSSIEVLAADELLSLQDGVPAPQRQSRR